MNNLLKYATLYWLLASMAACNEGTNETVESAYLLPVYPEPSYKFSRNGESSVNIQECQFLKTPIDRIFSEYMAKAEMGTKTNYDEALKLYLEGGFGLKPKEEIATSPTHLSSREKIVKDIDNLLQISARLSGLGASSPREYREREAVKGSSGYVGNSIADYDIYFVDEKGIAVAEVYKYAMMGAVYLDKVVNKHLNEQVLKNNDIIIRHDQTQLLPGHNYTELEHHWDLAYGYYGFWKVLAQPEGLPALKGSHRRIYRSFVRGRTYMASARYDEMRLQADTIKQELSKVVASRAMQLLIGDNTLINLKESAQSAFRQISQAYGLLYASQFACNAQGKPIMTKEETRQLLQELEKEGGLWDKERLLGEEQKEGSLRNLAARIGEKFGISSEDIKK
ncbi:DUF4856 domain-containing protein [Bacteroides sp.]|uniref:DUF4856 domain-containing protein n=1 Tax=Bacteroides sp. TaxID=29523 RepID=UPI002FC956F5